MGNPKWVVQKVEAVGGVVYHDVTERRFAEKALEGGVKGLICVNNRAGGHAGTKVIEELFEALKDFNVPLICAGGIGGAASFTRALRIGYDGVQMGTRFIASNECRANSEYKKAIVSSGELDIVLTERLTGVPVSVIKTPYVEKIGTKAGPVARFLLSRQKTKHWMRLFYSLQSVWKLKRSLLKGSGYHSYFQAGKSVSEISKILPVKSIMEELKKAYLESVLPK